MLLQHITTNQVILDNILDVYAIYHVFPDNMLDISAAYEVIQGNKPDFLQYISRNAWQQT
jgi:hypothetical protein